GTASCIASSCQVASCNVGFADCNNQASDGCETNTGTSVANCGGCGHVCSGPNAQSFTCTSGTCHINSCAAGFADCNNDASDGCETNINTLTNCGGCGIQCSIANGTAACTSGQCQAASCNAGFTNCGASCASPHTNGLGQNYNDCSDSLGVPGDPTTY